MKKVKVGVIMLSKPQSTVYCFLILRQVMLHAKLDVDYTPLLLSYNDYFVCFDLNSYFSPYYLKIL